MAVHIVTTPIVFFPKIISRLVILIKQQRQQQFTVEQESNSREIQSSAYSVGFL